MEPPNRHDQRLEQMKAKHYCALVPMVVVWIAIGYELFRSGKYRGTNVGLVGATKNTLSTLESFFLFYVETKHRWPTQDTWTSELSSVLNPSEIKYFESLQTDHWGSPILYISTNNVDGVSRVLRSSGPDRLFGDSNDIVWPMGLLRCGEGEGDIAPTNVGPPRHL